MDGRLDDFRSTWTSSRLVRLGFLAAFACGCVVAALGLASSSAFAQLEQVGTFAGTGSGPGGGGSEPGQLSNPGQIDVNDASGRVYVADTGNNRVEAFKQTSTGVEFDSEVAVTAPTGVAVDQADGDVYVANGAGVSKFDAAMTPVAGWTDPGVTGALTVDGSTGDLLVADAGANLIRRFHPDGTAAGSFAAEGPLDVAAEADGDLLVVTSTGSLLNCATSAVRRFTPAGTPGDAVDESLVAPSAVAIDPDDGTILVAANTNGYNCPVPGDPEVVAIGAVGTVIEEVTLPGTQYATVSGLAAQGGGSARIYAVTKSPAGDSFGPTKGFVLANPQPGSPAVISQAARATDTELELSASLDRGNAPAEYLFEFGPSTSYGLATPSAKIPAGGGPLVVRRAVVGVQPGTTYHYRVVVKNAFGQAEGIDQTVTTQPATEDADGCSNAASRAAQSSAFLPQCRAWEMVSPPSKNGNDIFYETGQAAVNGNGVVFTAGGAFGDAQSNSLETSYVAFRAADGWKTEGLAPPMRNNLFLVEGVRQVTDSLDYSVSTARLMSDPGAVSFVRRSAATGGFELLSPRPNGEKWNVFEGYGSADLSRYVFVSEGPLREGDPPKPFWASYLYEMNTHNGVLRLVDEEAEAALGSGRGLIPDTAVSADGSRIFITKGARGPGVVPEGQLFVQRNGTEMVEVSASKLATPEAERSGAFFLQATRSGSKVLFGDAEKLTEASKADGGTTQILDGGDLYLYDVDTDSLTDLSASAPAGGGHLLGLLGAADDFATVYFVDRTVLASGATSGAPNVYLWTAGGGVKFIATLAETDNSTWAPGWLYRAARVSANGSALVFQSSADLNGYKTNGFTEVYRYSRDDGSLVCASCLGGQGTADGRILNASGQRRNSIGGHQTNWVTADGSTVYFTTAAKLVSRDVNGLPDVYAWKNGEVSLLSSGRGDAGSYFLDASPSGSDVFFTTRQRLVAWDTDDLIDVYDARVAGGLPEPLPPPRPCIDEGCKAADRSVPSGAMPGTASNLGNTPRCTGLARRASRLESRAATAKKAAKGKKGKQRRHAKVVAKRAQAKAKTANKKLDKCKRGQ